MGHEYQDAVSLEIHRRVAAGLPTRPEWMAMARENLARWTELHQDSPGLLRCDREWAELLERSSVAEVCAIITAQTDEGQRLRQNSPFVGMLSPQEVWEIKARMRHEAA